jgi:hypothetical protein
VAKITTTKRSQKVEVKGKSVGRQTGALIYAFAFYIFTPGFKNLASYLLMQGVVLSQLHGNATAFPALASN